MSGGGPVLLRTNMGAGHGGASGRFDRLDEVAIVYAFALWAVGMADDARCEDDHAKLHQERFSYP
jgi:oligopeptidase B